jgi:hypothetical protein
MLPPPSLTLPHMGGGNRRQRLPDLDFKQLTPSSSSGYPVFQRRFVFMREATAYWMPRLKRGMTIRVSAISRRDAPEFCSKSPAF